MKQERHNLCSNTLWSVDSYYSIRSRIAFLTAEIEPAAPVLPCCYLKVEFCSPLRITFKVQFVTN